jgi:DNA-binding MarR family transcriptional regulator
VSIPDEGLEAGALAMRDFMAYAVLFQDAVARKAGLNGTDVQALGLLLRNGPMTAGALADQAGLTAGGAITAVIDRLASAGLVARSADPGDRRRVLITADPQVAWSRLAPWYADVTERWNAYLAGLSSTEAALVVAAISTAAQINREELARLREK